MVGVRENLAQGQPCLLYHCSLQSLAMPVYSNGEWEVRKVTAFVIEFIDASALSSSTSEISKTGSLFGGPQELVTRGYMW